MIAVYFLIGFIVIISIIYLYHKVTKKPRSETTFAMFSHDAGYNIELEKWLAK